jgi:large subunit ribosomal protein L4
MQTIKKSVAIKKTKTTTKKSVAVSATHEKKSVKKNRVQPVADKKDASLHMSFPVLSPKGEKDGTVSLPKEIFAVSYNAQLVAQAIRVYEMNQREGSAATKTRGMVEGSTRKIYRQKGTGRARHGGIRGPIFVGGGIIFGPEPRDIHKTMSKQMKKKALLCAISYAVENAMMKVVDGLASLPVKTKIFAEMLKNIQVSRRILVIYGKETKTIIRAVRNIKQITVIPFDSLSVYDVMTHAYIVFTKDALSDFIAKYKHA